MSDESAPARSLSEDQTRLCNRYHTHKQQFGHRHLVLIASCTARFAVARSRACRRFLLLRGGLRFQATTHSSHDKSQHPPSRVYPHPRVLTYAALRCLLELQQEQCVMDLEHANIAPLRFSRTQGVVRRCLCKFHFDMALLVAQPF
jgi:hypothetical protein